MPEDIIVSREFLNQQLDRAKEAAHHLTGIGAMSREDALALQLLADICRALKSPLLEDVRPVDQRRLIKESLKGKKHDTILREAT